MKKFCLVILCVAGLSYGCGSSEPTTEFKAVATTQDVMESLVAHMSQEIWTAVSIEIDKDGVHEHKPQNKDEWQEVGYAARGLAESSSLLLYDGRLEDKGDWQMYVKDLTDKALIAAKAADDQDPDALMQAGGDIYEVCTKCHEAYLEKVQMKRTGGKAEPPPAIPAPGAPTK